MHRKAWMLFGSHSFVFWVWRYDICTMHKCRRVCKIVNYVRLDVYKNKCKWIIFIKKPSKNRRFFPGSLSEGLIYIWNLESGDHPYKRFSQIYFINQIWSTNILIIHLSFGYTFWKSNIQIHRFFPFFFFSLLAIENLQNHFCFLNIDLLFLPSFLSL